MVTRHSPLAVTSTHNTIETQPVASASTDTRSQASPRAVAADLFPDVAAAYAHLSDAALRWTAQVLSYLSKPWCRRYVLPYVRPAWGRWAIVAPYIKRTLFQYFCGGESGADCTAAVKRLHAHGIYSILDYATEEATTDEVFAACAAETERALHAAATHKAIAFAALKPSAMGHATLMAKRTQGVSLERHEEESLKTFEQRLQALCQVAHEQRVPLLVDAEKYACQPYIDEQVMRLSAEYNKTRVCVYNTFQLYLKDGYKRLQHMHEQARREGFLLGAKLVRGAYMETEHKLAHTKGRASPIQDSKAACDADYDRALLYVLDNLSDCALFAGTHNADSCLLLYEETKTRGIPPDHPHLWFSQLYGMSENLSYGLARAGFRVAKYIPYGPYAQLLPYLHRRILENSAVQQQSGREQKVLQREWQRRKQHTAS